MNFEALGRTLNDLTAEVVSSVKERAIRSTKNSLRTHKKDKMSAEKNVLNEKLRKENSP